MEEVLYAEQKKGALANVHPVDWATETLKGVLAQVPQFKNRNGFQT